MRRSIRGMMKKPPHLNQAGQYASGNPRYYYRPKGQKGVALPDYPIDDPRWLAAYTKAAGVKPRAPVVSGSLASAVLLYKADDAFKFLAQSTKESRRRMLDSIAGEYGFARAEQLEQKHIRKDLSQFSGNPHNSRLKHWRGFCKFLVRHHGLENDPSDGLKRAAAKKTDGHIPWDQGQVDQFRSYWAIGSMERLAFELIFWTGARISDAISLGKMNVDCDGWLVFNQQKTGGEVAIPFDRELPNFAERYAGDLDLLHSAISARNERHMTFLHTQHGKSRSPKSFSQWFAAKARKAAITGRTAHGLRKSRAILLVEAGGTSPQIGAWTGHESLSEIEHYIRKFDKRKALTKTNVEQKVPTQTIKFQKRQ